ncbi:MAG: glycerophosphodiester phosphodiesterase family protein [Rhodanobacteraceae bacterium]
MKLIAHRGGSGLRVENTLAAFSNALKLGADGAELDVHLTRDGEVVVHHDARLNSAYCRKPDGRWITRGEERSLAELTYAEIRQYEIGVPDPRRAYARRFDRIEPVRRQRIPLLQDVIRLAKSRSDNFFLVIEIKTPVLEAARQPWATLVDRTLDVIDGEAFVNRSILCSFDWGSLIYARQQRPGLATWLTTDPLSWFGRSRPPPGDIPPDAAELRVLRSAYQAGAPWFAGFDPRRCGRGIPEAIAAAGGSAWLMYASDFTRERAQTLAGFGLGAVVWTANLRDRAALAHLVRMGATNLMLDYPDVNLAAMAAPGLS